MGSFEILTNDWVMRVATWDGAQMTLRISLGRSLRKSGIDFKRAIDKLKRMRFTDPALIVPGQWWREIGV